MKNNQVELHYIVINQGDGSVHVSFFNDKEEAESKEEESEEPFAESSVNSLQLRIINGIICFKSESWNGKEFKTNWVKLK